MLVGLALVAVGALFCVANWVMAIRYYRTGKGSSMVPLGGPLALAGCALVPAVGSKIGLLALAADPLMLAIVAAGPRWAWRRARRTG